MKPRVVLDTNIFVSSTFWKGNPYKIVKLALSNKIEVFISTEILKELERALKRDFKEPEEIIVKQIKLILSYAILIEPQVRIDVIKEDVTDNRILECAAACKANYIITGDKHLLKLRKYKGIKILKANEFLDLIKNEGEKNN